eukprot:TRINITY_DN733_c1_g1_i1.p1 TRINITY_DN733_c1_g1~~TRINITY_DN733_c1_g1_i1.p1  ORF type:complete len:549 (+),score=172.25 TRINITY_DN733_c1_g1_i1:106-1752(+)
MAVEEVSILELISNWIAIIFLVSLSALFSGLTLGLLGLDKVGLKIVIESGSEAEKKYAQKIYPVRKRGNLLLCTLLLGNVAVNSLLSILMADLTSGLVGFFVSTGIIVVFGEIVPQAACSRHALWVGSRTVKIVQFFIHLLFPVAFPISLVLDLALGREMGTIYSKKELKKLLSIHGDSTASDLTREETQILTGALDFATKRAESIMTPLEKVFMLEVEEKLDTKEINLILENGYSRIPVYETNKTNIIGLLLLRDLILLNPEEGITIRSVMKLYQRNLLRVFDDTPLNEVLTGFKTGKSHIAVVQRVNSDGDGDPFYETLGIVTLEDIIEEILQDEINDESDVIIPRGNIPRKSVEISRLRGILKQPNMSFFPPDEVETISQFLGKVSAFSTDNVSEEVLKKLVSTTPIVELPEGQVLIQSSKPNTHFFLVIQGSARKCTSDGETRIGALGSVGLEALSETTHIPNYSVELLEQSTLLRISRAMYHSAVSTTRLKLENRNSSDFDPNEVMTQEEMREANLKAQRTKKTTFSPVSRHADYDIVQLEEV